MDKYPKILIIKTKNEFWDGSDICGFQEEMVWKVALRLACHISWYFEIEFIDVHEGCYQLLIFVPK